MSEAAAPSRPLVMGIVNVTPDSFSDGGLAGDTEKALAHARRLIAEGADFLDVGGESTRPGAAPVSEDEELSRVIPVIRRLSEESDLPISIDTRKPAVARAALEAGAAMWNDVSALTGDRALVIAAALEAPVVLMHMQGEPASMQQSPRYDDAAGEVEDYLLTRARAAEAAGVARRHIWLDPGVGFGKTLAHNLSVLAALPRLASHGYPLLLGASRKRFIAHIDPAGEDVNQRLGGSVAVALWGARCGCAMVRVHDVAETVQALKVWTALSEATHVR